MTKDTVGEFEHQVLLATLRLKAEAYTTSIVLELTERAGREVAPAAVHIALARLEENGFISSQIRHGPGRGGFRERRYVTVTARGLNVLRVSRRRLLGLWEGLEPLLERN
ncbi:MAG: PadR family transcriptional regulator [Gemmatimonadales bacterium]|nr:PadR family transcriptional regulator [Gemmatimonadales bacterium]